MIETLNAPFIPQMFTVILNDNKGNEFGDYFGGFCVDKWPSMEACLNDAITYGRQYIKNEINRRRSNKRQMRNNLGFKVYAYKSSVYTNDNIPIEVYEVDLKTILKEVDCL